MQSGFYYTFLRLQAERAGAEADIDAGFAVDGFARFLVLVVVEFDAVGRVEASGFPAGELNSLPLSVSASNPKNSE